MRRKTLYTVAAVTLIAAGLAGAGIAAAQTSGGVYQYLGQDTQSEFKDQIVDESTGTLLAGTGTSTTAYNVSNPNNITKMFDLPGKKAFAANDGFFVSGISAQPTVTNLSGNQVLTVDRTMRSATITGNSFILGNRQSVAKYDLSTGNKSWENNNAKAGDTMTTNGNIIVTTDDYSDTANKHRGIDLSTGSILWERNSSLTGPTDTHNGKVLIGNGNKLIALDITTGEKLWENQITLGGSKEIPITSEGHIIGESGAAYDADTGEKVFSGDLGYSEDNIIEQATFGNVVFLSGFDISNSALQIYQVDYSSNFNILSLDNDGSGVEEGESVNVTTEIENTGTIQGQKNIEVDIPGLNETRQTTVNLSPSETKNLTFTFNTEVGDEGVYTATVQIPNTSKSSSTSFSVGPKTGELSVDDINVPDETGNGTDVDVSVNLSETTGFDIPGQRDVTFEIGSQSVTTSVGPVNASENLTVTQTVPTSNLDVGTYDLSVRTPSDEKAKSGFDVVPAELIIKSVDLPTQPVVIPSTQSVTVDVVIENTGGFDITEFVNLQTDPGIGFAQQEPTFNPGENTVSLTLDVPDVNSREYDYEITLGQTEDPRDSLTINNVRYTDADELVSQETVTVDPNESIVTDAVVEQPGEVVVRYETVNANETTTGSETFEVESVNGESELKTFRVPVEDLNETRDLNVSLSGEDASTIPETYYDTDETETEPPAAGGGGSIEFGGSEIPLVAVGVVGVVLLLLFLRDD